MALTDGVEIFLPTVEFSDSGYVGTSPGYFVYTQGVEISSIPAIEFATGNFLAWGPQYTTFSNGFEVGIPEVNSSLPFIVSPSEIKPIFQGRNFEIIISALPVVVPDSIPANFLVGQEVVIEAYLYEPIEGFYMISSDEYFSKIQPAKSEELINAVEITTQPLRPKTATEEVYKTQSAIAINAGQTITIDAKYKAIPVIVSPAPTVSITDNSGVSIAVETSSFYSWGATIAVKNNDVVNGSFNLAITGTILEVSGTDVVSMQDSTSVRENGYLKYSFPNNHLIQSKAVADAIATKLLASYKTPRKDIQISWRGNPALELGDQISISEYAKHGLNISGNFYIIRQKHEYNGTYSAVTDGRKIIAN